MFLVDANRYGKDPAAASQKIVRMLEEPGGDVLVSRLWEERRLAYPIRGHRRGVYWLTYFRLDGRHIDDIRRQCQQSDLILRELILKVDPRIVDALVAHAQSGEAGRPVGFAAASQAEKTEKTQPSKGEGQADEENEPEAAVSSEGASEGD
jgi:small subunit ribosomal protein S6